MFSGQSCPKRFGQCGSAGAADGLLSIAETGRCGGNVTVGYGARKAGVFYSTSIRLPEKIVKKKHMRKRCPDRLAISFVWLYTILCTQSYLIILYRKEDTFLFRILDRDAARRLEMRRMLYRMMLFSEDFSYEDAAGIPREGTDALLLIRPEAADVEALSPCLSGELSGIPVICYGTQTAPRFAPGVPAAVCAERRPADLRELLLRTVLDLTGRRIDEWQVGALSDHLLEPSPRVFGTPVHLSQTQRMILRYLMEVHPKGAALKELKSHCLRPGSDCTDGNIPAHIGQINRIFEPYLRERCIENREGRYRFFNL